MDYFTQENANKQMEKWEHISDEYRLFNRNLMEKLLIINGAILAFSASLQTVTNDTDISKWAVIISWTLLLLSSTLSVLFLYYENRGWYLRSTQFNIGYTMSYLADQKLRFGEIDKQTRDDIVAVGFIKYMMAPLAEHMKPILRPEFFDEVKQRGSLKHSIVKEDILDAKDNLQNRSAVLSGKLQSKLFSWTLMLFILGVLFLVLGAGGSLLSSCK